MGRLFYGSSTEPIEVPERVLAHLKIVTATKLRRSESFTVSWRTGEADTPGSTTTIWCHAAIPLRFEFDTAENMPIEREYLQELADAANTSGGISIDLREQVEAKPAKRVRALEVAA